MKLYCITHDSYDDDGDGECGVYSIASPQVKKALHPCDLVLTCCPSCGSDKGFQLDYSIHGRGYEERDFKGNVLDADKTEIHDTNSYVVCLNCNVHFPTEKVNIE